MKTLLHKTLITITALTMSVVAFGTAASTLELNELNNERVQPESILETGGDETGEAAEASDTVPVDPNFLPNLLFSARLSGNQEVPAVMTDASGIGGFLLNATRDTIWVNIHVNMLSGPITAIHIHEGEMGMNGDVVTNLGDMVEGNRIQGFITDFDLNKYITGGYYVNVHTDANPAGEIRGQILFEADQTLLADVTGDQEVPEVMTDARGMGVFTLVNNQSMLQVRVVVDGLSGPIMGAHLHLGAMGMNGPVVSDLTPMVEGNLIVAEVDPSDFLTELIAGDIYLNIHTADNMDGEIRGQLNWAKALVIDSWLNGAQEVPAVEEDGAGVAAMWMNPTWDTLYYDIQVTQLSGMIDMAHIHTGEIGENGGVLVNLTDDIMGNRIMGFVAGDDLTSGLIDELLWGTTYINVHTMAYPSGEIRGQNLRLARDGYSFDMCGNQVDPSLDLMSYGGGILSIDRWATNAHLMFTTTDLTGPITAAHLHDGMIGENGPVLYDVTSSISNGSGYSYFEIDLENTMKIKMGEVYLNVHTEDFPDGELRGQLDNMYDCPSIITSTEDGPFRQTQLDVFPNPVGDELTIEIPEDLSSDFRLRVVNVVGAVVFEQNVSNASNLERISFSRFNPGIYFVQIEGQSESYIQRVVKK